MRAYQSPDEILRQLGIAKPCEIDLEAIAFHCGATVKYRQLDGCAARIIGSEHRAIITVDENTMEPRRRFSIGHELGHWLCDRGIISVSCQRTDFSDFRKDGAYREGRANRFAADLLLPAFLFRPAAKGMPITFESVRELAASFKASQTATAIRLVELGSYPSIIACYGRNQRNWWWAHPDVPSGVWPHRHLTDGSLAHDLVRQGRRRAGPEEVDADAWIDHSEAHRYVVWEDSVQIFDGCVLTLIWWKEEAQLLMCD